MKHLEKIKGKGTVTSQSGETFPATYDIDVYQNEIPAGHLLDGSATIPGLKRYEGTVLPVRALGETQTLEMQDGRRMVFFFKDGNGAIALRQWIG
jgi:hypothetical protein